MVDLVDEGGLGLGPATAAEMVGHDDGGYLIATVYTKLGQRLAIARAQRAMDAYQQCQATEPYSRDRRYRRPQSCSGRLAWPRMQLTQAAR